MPIKTMKIALLSLCLFLLTFSTSAFVLDTDGDFLRNGGVYFILPVRKGSGGGLIVAQTGNETCALTVAQVPAEDFNGLQVTIASPYRIAYIYEGLILDFGFLARPTCATNSKWTVVEGLPVGWSVKLTGYENTLKGWFKIEKYQSDYKLVFCPSSSDTCGDIGIHIDEDGIRHLVVSELNGPFVVMFKKALRDSAAI